MKYYKSGRATEGRHKAIVLSVDVKPNQFFKHEEPEGVRNSKDTMTILFQLENGAQHFQNFVSPVCDYGLFSDLLRIAEIEFDSEGGELDPSQIEGTECEIQLVQNDKGYLNCYVAFEIESVKGNPNATEEEKEIAKKN